MAHGRNANKRYGEEWHAKRPLSWVVTRSCRPKTMHFFKRLLHKIERRQGKDLTEYSEEIWDHRTWWDFAD